jgi:predicted protein tyrosine phosphatase
MVTRALFVCSQNRLRSPTAEQVFAQFPELECESAGTDLAACVPLDSELIAWADVIFAMERSHRNRIIKKFKSHLNGKRLVVLDIPDEYEFMDPELIRILQRKVAPLLRVRFDDL